MNEKDFLQLKEYLSRIPGIQNFIAADYHGKGLWWVKFQIYVHHNLAWNVVQELGCVLNYLSINERLPTVFYPVSPAPYMNGGPEEFLS